MAENKDYQGRYTGQQVDELLKKAEEAGELNLENGSGNGSLKQKGSRNNAISMYSVTEGANNTAGYVGDQVGCQHAEGMDTQAIGPESHTEGYGTKVQQAAQGGHAEGIGTVVKNIAEHAEGANNASHNGSTKNLKTRHSVGIGDNADVRPEGKTQVNAHEIMQNGDHYIFGIGGYDGTNPEEAKTVQEVIGMTDNLETEAKDSIVAAINELVGKLKPEPTVVGTDLSFKSYDGTDLPARSTANCYVVNKDGEYSIPLVYGNGIKNGMFNTAAWTNIDKSSQYCADFVNHLNHELTSPYIEENEGCTAEGCELVWEDEDGFITDLRIVNGIGCRSLMFKASVPLVNANAIIAVKDTNGDIMWSWHIWGCTDVLSMSTFTNHTGVGYDMMNLYLGWKWDSAAKEHGKCTYFQWGRKDPMPCAASYNSTTNIALHGSQTYSAVAAVDTIGDSVKVPHEFLLQCDEVTYNWVKGTSKYNLWDAKTKTAGPSDNQSMAIKTIYDPTPAGCIVPVGRAFTGFTTTGDNTSTVSQFSVIDGWSAGWRFKRSANDAIGQYFPASGFRDRASGALNYVGSSVYVWSSASYSQAGAYYMYSYSGGVYPLNSSYRAYGFAVVAAREL